MTLEWINKTRKLRGDFPVWPVQVLETMDIATVFLISLCFDFGLLTGAPVQQGSHIFEGTVVSINQYPWVTTVEISKEGYTPGTCGGVLLSVMENGQESDIVLTAAHCVHEARECENNTEFRCSWEMKMAEMIKVYVGNTNLEEGETTEESRTAEVIEVHPKWNMNLSGCAADSVPASQCHVDDIAIIKVVGSFRFGQGVKGIRMAKRDESVAYPGECTVAGWGMYKNVDEGRVQPRRSDELRATQVTVLDKIHCAEAYNQPTDHFETLLCVKGQKHNGANCAGDSGGPLWCNDVHRHPKLYGLVSGGNGTCGPSLVGVYVSVAKHSDWIREVIRRISEVWMANL